MFLPDESYLRVAHEHDPSLQEYAWSSNVILASPSTLMILLRTVAMTWQQETIAESAREVSELGRELYKRLATMGAHVAKLGRSLDGAVDAYNKTVGSLERQVLVQARRFEQHGISGHRAAGAPADRAPDPVARRCRARRSRAARRSRPSRGRRRRVSAGTSTASMRSHDDSPACAGLRSVLKEELVSDVRDVIIIGGGPAGYTAALYTARANLRPLVIEGFNWGGQLMITSDVENYPGYADGVMGPTMMADFRRQAERFGAEFVTDDVTRVDFSERPFRVYVGDERAPRRLRHRRDRRERTPARAPVGADAPGPRRLLLRDL